MRLAGVRSGDVYLLFRGVFGRLQAFYISVYILSILIVSFTLLSLEENGSPEMFRFDEEITEQYYRNIHAPHSF
jgi:hypothetical protein